MCNQKGSQKKALYAANTLTKKNLDFRLPAEENGKTWNSQ